MPFKVYFLLHQAVIKPTRVAQLQKIQREENNWDKMYRGLKPASEDSRQGVGGQIDEKRKLLAMRNIASMYEMAESLADEKIQISGKVLELVILQLFNCFIIPQIDKHGKRLENDLNLLTTDQQPESTLPIGNMGIFLLNIRGSRLKIFYKESNIQQKKVLLFISPVVYCNYSSSGGILSRAFPDMLGGKDTDHLNSRQMMIEEIIDDAESEEALYCYCRQVSYGEMVECDNQDCPGQWFHFECVGLVESPAGVWYCTDCLLNHQKKNEIIHLLKDGQLGK